MLLVDQFMADFISLAPDNEISRLFLFLFFPAKKGCESVAQSMYPPQDSVIEIPAGLYCPTNNISPHYHM